MSRFIIFDLLLFYGLECSIGVRGFFIFIIILFIYEKIEYKNCDIICYVM